MSYFFLNKEKKIGLIQSLIEEYSGLEFRGNKILYKCEYCKFYIASKDIVCNVCHNYPGRKLIISKDVINKKICCHCCMRINSIHNITSSKCIY